MKIVDGSERKWEGKCEDQHREHVRMGCRVENLNYEEVREERKMDWAKRWEKRIMKNQKTSKVLSVWSFVRARRKRQNNNDRRCKENCWRITKLNIMSVRKNMLFHLLIFRDTNLVWLGVASILLMAILTR